MELAIPSLGGQTIETDWQTWRFYHAFARLVRGAIPTYPKADMIDWRVPAANTRPPAQENSSYEHQMGVQFGGGNLGADERLVGLSHLWLQTDH